MQVLKLMLRDFTTYSRNYRHWNYRRRYHIHILHHCHRRYRNHIHCLWTVEEEVQYSMGSLLQSD
jgi:hypothetical protein